MRQVDNYPIKEWPENPLQARNRNEVSLFLEWLKAEVLERVSAEGGEVCLGLLRDISGSGAPETYRFVFHLLEADAEDENDFGQGISRILDPADMMLLLSRMEREGLFGPGGQDANGEAASLLTYRTTREVEALRRANARGLGLIEQLTRFGQAEGHPAEESIKSSAKRTWFRGARERFELSTLEAKRRTFKEKLRLLEMPAANSAPQDKQAALVRELRARCPDYLSELNRQGFEDDHILHPLFSHAHHLALFAAHALAEGEAWKAHAAFAAWKATESNELLFPAREFAEAVFQSKLMPEQATSLVPADSLNTFLNYYSALADPDYNPWSY